MAEFHDEQTLFKVKAALCGEASTQGHWVACMDPDDAQDAIRRMQNAGIIFREFGPNETKVETEVNTWEIPEEMLLTRDQGIRVQALDIAVRSVSPAENFSNIEGYTQRFIDRAEMFEEYIRNGVIHNG